jgi:hypothetical protein
LSPWSREQAPQLDAVLGRIGDDGGPGR